MTARSEVEVTKLAGATAPRVPGNPTLGLLLLSTGSEHDLERALRCVADASLSCNVAVVRRSSAEDVRVRVSRLAHRYGVRMAWAPADSSRAMLADCGLPLLEADIISIREDGAIGDAGWLSPFDFARTSLTRTDAAIFDSAE